MSTLTVQLSDGMAARLLEEARRRNVPEGALVEQALEKTMPAKKPQPIPAMFARLQALMVNDPDSPTDLATNLAHLGDFGVARSA